jgi:hypothetical protein
MRNIAEHLISQTTPAIYIGGHALTPALTASEKILLFSQLENGWDYGNGESILDVTIRVALMWNERLSNFGFQDTNASAGTDGEVAIGAAWGVHYVEVIIENDDTVSIAYDFDRKQVFYRLRMPEADAYQTIIELVGKIWSASTSFIPASTTGTKIGGFEPLSGTTPAPYQLLAVNVWRSAALPLASTYENTIISSSPPSSGSPQYFGNSIPIYYRPEGV